MPDRLSAPTLPQPPTTSHSTTQSPGPFAKELHLTSPGTVNECSHLHWHPSGLVLSSQERIRSPRQSSPQEEGHRGQRQSKTKQETLRSGLPEVMQ